MHDKPFIPKQRQRSASAQRLLQTQPARTTGHVARHKTERPQCVLRAKLSRREHKFMQQQRVPTEFRLLPQNALIYRKPNVSPVDAKHGIGRGPPHIDDTQPVKRKAGRYAVHGCDHRWGMRATTLMAFWKSLRWAHGSNERRPGFVSCGSGFSLVHGGNGANKRFERKYTHSSRQLKICFPGPKPEQHAPRTPSTAAIIRRGLRADAEMAFWRLQIWARVGSAGRPGSVCCASSRSDTVVVVSFDRFHFRDRKGAVKRI